MAYLKPPWFTAKVFNRIAMRTGIAGTEILTLTTRTGAQQRIPVISVDVDDIRYLVSTRGESQWVRNVRANPVVMLSTGASTQRFAAVELPVSTRAPILSAYRAKAGKTVDRYFSALPDPADHPVFRLADDREIAP